MARPALKQLAASGASDGQAAVYSSSSGKWAPSTIVGVTTATTALTDAATVSVTAAQDAVFTLLTTSGVGATRAIGNPSGLVAGQRFQFLIEVDTTGRGVTFSSYFKGTIPLFTGMTANQFRVVSCLVKSTTSIATAFSEILG